MRAPSGASDSGGSSQAVSGARTVESSRCHVGPSGHRALVVGLARVRVQVEARRLVHEVRSVLAPGEPAGALLPAERVEVGPQVAVRPPHLVEEGRPRRAVRGRVPRRERRDRRVLELGGVARQQPDPRPPGRHDRGEADDVVLDDHVRAELVDDLREPRLDVLRAVHQRLERGGDELAELLDRGLAEHGRRVPDEVDPELAGDLGLRGRRPRRISRSSNPFASRFPANDSSTMNTTRWPRARRTLPIPTQLLVGP